MQTKFSFSSEIEKGELIIYDLLGNLIETVSILNSKEAELDRKNMSSGIYIYKFTDQKQNKLIGTGKIIVY